MAKAQVEIGQRAYEEVLRIFEKMQDARVALGTSNKNHLYEWMNGVAPSAKYLQRLHYLGADVIYILTGVRKRLVHTAEAKQRWLTADRKKTVYIDGESALPARHGFPQRKLTWQYIKE